MNIHDLGPCRMTVLTVCEAASDEYLNLAATLIRQLPPVWRVRVNFAQRQLEVLAQSPSPGLLQALHRALLSAGSASRLVAAD